MRRGRRALPSVILALSAVLLLAGCGITHMQNLSFRVDKRLHFTAPKARSKAHQPLTVSWTMRDFRVAALGSEPPSRDAGYFAVFVDSAPVKPGQTLRAVAAGDPSCERNPKCPDNGYLAAHGVFVTTVTSLHLPLIPNVAGTAKVQQHAITVVLMNTAGHRIGESAWELDFRLPRVGLS